ncbi:MAG: hypothetical protein ACD_44C00125G0002 [uncultured bacterium]|nr:MAG: hypothetical protein ACD_44C00125G0002 [uncultured bacterium]
MNTLELLHHIQNKGIHLSLTVDDNIEVYPRSELTDSIRNLIRDNKRLLLIVLRQKQAELKQLIKQVSTNYGGDDEPFLEEYINDVLHDWSGDLQTALACFRGLDKQQPFNKWK